MQLFFLTTLDRFYLPIEFCYSQFLPLTRDITSVILSAYRMFYRLHVGKGKKLYAYSIRDTYLEKSFTKPSSRESRCFYCYSQSGGKRASYTKLQFQAHMPGFGRCYQRDNRRECVLSRASCCEKEEEGESIVGMFKAVPHFPQFNTASCIQDMTPVVR